MADFLIVAGALSLLIYWLARGRKTRARRRAAAPKGAKAAARSSGREKRSPEVAAFFSAAQSSPFDPLTRLRAGDIDGARLALQKIAYIVHADKQANPALVEQFKGLMCKFVKIDPLFWRCLRAIEPVVKSSPGIHQTKLYSHMQVDTETARYVLYFAEATGHLVRRKRGNTYEVFNPDQEIPVMPPSTRRSKA